MNLIYYNYFSLLTNFANVSYGIVRECILLSQNTFISVPTGRGKLYNKIYVRPLFSYKSYFRSIFLIDELKYDCRPILDCSPSNAVKELFIIERSCTKCTNLNNDGPIRELLCELLEIEVKYRSNLNLPIL